MFCCIFFLHFFVIKTLDTDPDLLEMLDPDFIALTVPLSNRYASNMTVLLAKSK